MSEYIWANIKIGGIISRSVLTHLAEKFDVPLPLSEATEAEAALSEAAPYLELEDESAAEGRFEKLEAYLLKQAIPFDRVSDGKYEYTPELRRFRPSVTDGQGNVSQPEVDRTFLCDHDSRPMAAFSDIEKAIGETGTREELAARLTDLCGLDIPDLPPLQIVSSGS